MIGYMDHQISQVQQQLKSIKNVKKLQQKVISEDVQNAQLKQRLTQYQNQVKNFKDKLKDIDRKSRKKQQQFKKQQAYQIALEKKMRKTVAQEKQLQKPEIQKPKQMTQKEFQQVKQQLVKAKNHYEQLIKRVQNMRKTIKSYKQQRILNEEKYKDKQQQYKTLFIQAESFNRLLKDLQLKKYQQTGIQTGIKSKQNTKILKLSQIEDEIEESKSSMSNRIPQNQISKSSGITPFMQKSSNPKQWKGKVRKVSMGYTVPTDQIYQQSGYIIGLKTFLDQNKFITGLGAIILVNGLKKQSKLIGRASNVELKWQAQPGDNISQILGSFSQQGYLGEIILKTNNGLTAKFGNSFQDNFKFKLQKQQLFSGIFVGIRKLGQDVRITELGFWISSNEINPSGVSI